MADRLISMKNHLTLMKFGELKQILNPVTIGWPKIIFFSNLRWRMDAILKVLFGHNSVANFKSSFRNIFSPFGEILLKKHT